MIACRQRVNCFIKFLKYLHGFTKLFALFTCKFGNYEDEGGEVGEEGSYVKGVRHDQRFVLM